MFRRWLAWLIGVPVALFAVVLLIGLFAPKDKVLDRQLDFTVRCQNEVAARLKSPSSTKFSNAAQDGVMTTAQGLRWRGYVDAENSFGAHPRTHFTCDGTPESVTVEFDDQ